MIRRLLYGTALVVGSLVTVVVVVALGGGLLLVPVSIAALSWAAVSSYRGTETLSAAGYAVPDAPDPRGPVELTTRQLCVAWEMSGSLLTRTAPGAERDQIVALRRRYLDELERRDPNGFRRWLDAGSAWADEPGRYLDGGGGPTTTAA